jgi:predicted DNA-binding transcriptional regulator AlpA
MQSIAAVRPPEAAKYVGISTSTLAKMRLRGDGPAYLKLGPRAVAYRIVDLEEWLTTHRRRSTSESKHARSA